MRAVTTPRVFRRSGRLQQSSYSAQADCKGGRLLPRRRKSTLRNIVSEPLDIGELLDFAGASRLLVRLVEDHAAEYCAPLESHGRTAGVALL